jgi:hypothetical protein
MSSVSRKRNGCGDTGAASEGFATPSPEKPGNSRPVSWRRVYREMTVRSTGKETGPLLYQITGVEKSQVKHIPLSCLILV